MKKQTFVAAALLCIAIGSANAAIIIGGSTGDGNFNAVANGSGTLPFSSSPSWFNASGIEASDFTSSEFMIGSSESPNDTPGAISSRDVVQVNSTGHTVAAAGETFSLNYEFGASGSPSAWDGTESHRTFLFTANAAVDADLTTANMTWIATNTHVLNRGTGGQTQWTTPVFNNFYTTGTGDIGMTFYFGMEFKDSNGSNNGNGGRIDVIELNVTTGGPTNRPPTLTGWQQFVTDYNLSGDQLADADGDGQRDVFEFLHGGNPTNAAELATEPFVSTGVGGEVDLLSVETAHTNPGVAWTAEWTDNLATGVWQHVWDKETNTAAALAGYNDVERQLLGVTNDSLFCRVNVSSRPNILFILADDLGYEDVSFNAPTAGVTPEITTPELDSLATNGTIFTSAYVVHPFCGPSRMGLMAGRYPHHFGGPFNLPDTSDYADQGISTNETLFSTVLHDAGYHTGIMGKWHLGIQAEHHPNVRGFDEFYGFLGGGQVYFGPYQAGGWSYARYPQENGTSDTSLTASDHITDVLTERGTNFIYQSAATADPFFLFMSYNAPHSVLTYNGNPQAHASDMAMFPALTGNRQIYAGLVYGMDRCVGELVQALKDTGQYDNTLIVFLSDNGGREDVTGSGKNGVLRGDKGDVTEGGFRVPMFMHWPGVIPAGANYDHPVTALDFYPTFARLALAEIPVSQDIEGKDIWDDVLSGNNARPGEPIYTVAYSTTASSVGIRQDQWKALKLGNNNWLLYDIVADIGETMNVSGANPLVLSNLVSEGGTWSGGHVQPLWWNNTGAESTWNANNMPHYETVFTLP